jgi:hypothetical protein
MVLCMKKQQRLIESRFLNLDPDLSDVENQNGYVYTNNNPVMYKDTKIIKEITNGA